jgi:4-hydroxybenzoate polyprenyltransferase
MSSTDLVRAWMAERYRPAFFVPLAVLLYVTGTLAVDGTPTVGRGIVGIAVAYSLVLLFRIWDDLADSEADRIAHPDRVLARTRDTTPLGSAMTLATLFPLLVLTFSAGKTVGVVAFATIASILLIWYSVRKRIGAGRLANAHVVLLKYPTIALIAAAAGSTTRPSAVMSARALVSLIAIYLVACLYEVMHDRTLSSRGSQP